MIFFRFFCALDVCSNSDLSIKIQCRDVNLFVSAILISKQSSKAFHTTLTQWDSCSDSTSFSLNIQDLGVVVPKWALPSWNILGSASWSNVILSLSFLTDFIHYSSFKRRGYLSRFIEIIIFLSTSVTEPSSDLSFLAFAPLWGILFLPVLSCSRRSFTSAVSSKFLQVSLAFICWFLICKSIPTRTPVNCLCLPRYWHGPLHHSNWVSGFILRAHADIHAHWTTNLHSN